MTSDRPRIALVRARYNPYGGAEQFAARAFALLATGPADVTVIARDWTRGNGAALAPRIIKCDPFYLGSLWRDWSFGRAVRRLVARSAFDLVQSHERIAGLDIYRAGDGVHAAWLERRQRGASLATRIGIALNLHHRYLVRAERALFEHSRLRAVICNSLMVRDEILGRFAIEPSKLHLIHNGVDLKRFSPQLRLRHRASERDRLAIPVCAPLLLFVGSGFARKGLAPLLHAFASIDPSAHLLVVGGDKHAARYAALADRLGLEGRVHFLGEQSETTPLYGAADGFVLPTLYDPFPNAVLEALASGLPVVTTDGCGAREIIRDGENGWVVPAGDVARLAAALSRLLDTLTGEVATREGFADAARASVAGMDSDSMATQLLALYRRLLEPG